MAQADNEAEDAIVANVKDGLQRDRGPADQRRGRARARTRCRVAPDFAIPEKRPSAPSRWRRRRPQLADEELIEAQAHEASGGGTTSTPTSRSPRRRRRRCAPSSTGRGARVVLAHGLMMLGISELTGLTKGQAHTLMDDAKTRFGGE
jgi:hypothetical protein